MIDVWTNKRKSKLVNVVLKSWLIFLLVVITISILFPVYFVVATSLKSYGEYVKNPILIDFSAVSFGNYVTVLKSNNLFRAFGNSVVITAISVVAMVIFSALGSFAISVIRFKGSQLFKSLSVITMFFTGELTYIPLFLL